MIGRSNRAGFHASEIASEMRKVLLAFDIGIRCDPVDLCADVHSQQQGCPPPPPGACTEWLMPFPVYADPRHWLSDLGTSYQT
jgi:hypothetical protein